MYTFYIQYFIGLKVSLSRTIIPMHFGIFIKIKELYLIDTYIGFFIQNMYIKTI